VFKMKFPAVPCSLFPISCFCGSSSF